jgi:hypothetical protein
VTRACLSHEECNRPNRSLLKEKTLKWRTWRPRFVGRSFHRFQDRQPASFDEPFYTVPISIPAPMENDAQVATLDDLFAGHLLD